MLAEHSCSLRIALAGLERFFLTKEYEQSIGIPVLLSYRCTPQQIQNRGEGRQFRLDHSSFVNNDLMPVEDDLRGQIAGVGRTARADRFLCGR